MRTSRFIVADAEDAVSCEPRRAWKFPESVRALITDARRVWKDGFVGVAGGHALARAWGLFGVPQLVGDGRFQFVLRDSVGGSFVGISVDADADPPAVMLCSSADDASVLDALEDELNNAQPVNCSLDVPGSGYDFTIGFRKGRTFLKLALDN